MPAYQSDYERFYYSIEHEVNRRCRINIHKRIYENLHKQYDNIKLFLIREGKRIKDDFEYNVIRRLFPNYYYKMEFRRSCNAEGSVCCQYTEPDRDIHYYGEPTDEKISLSQYAYGKLIDQKYKKRFIDAKNQRSHESSLAIQKEAANYLFEQKMKSSFLLRFINFFHLN